MHTMRAYIKYILLFILFLIISIPAIFLSIFFFKIIYTVMPAGESVGKSVNFEVFLAISVSSISVIITVLAVIISIVAFLTFSELKERAGKIAEINSKKIASTVAKDTTENTLNEWAEDGTLKKDGGRSLIWDGD